jgi:PAS domain S-box-containing protein
VCNDAKRSEELFERANQIDDLRRRANTANGGSIDVLNVISNGGSDSDAAIVTIDHKGIILSANNGIKSIFNYEKPQAILGENVSILVPPPFDRIHNQFLDRYMKVGEGQIIAKLRKVFAVRSDGYLIPVRRHI